MKVLRKKVVERGRNTNASEPSHNLVVNLGKVGEGSNVTKLDRRLNAKAP